MRKRSRVRHSSSLATAFASAVVLLVALALCLLDPVIAIAWLGSTALMTWMHS